VNVMSAGEGNDTFDLDGSHAINTITGGAGQNTYIIHPEGIVFGNIDTTNYIEKNIVTDFKAGDGGDIIRMPPTGYGGSEGFTDRATADQIFLMQDGKHRTSNKPAPRGTNTHAGKTREMVRVI